jgi:hypothetical protein
MRENYIKTLILLSKKLKGLNFAFVGSVSLYLQGIKSINPRDIDLIVYEKDLIEISNILKEFKIKDYFENDMIFKTIFKVNNIEVEILNINNNSLRGEHGLDRKINIDFENLKLPCIDLRDDLKVYEELERSSKVNLIKNFLKNN